MRTLRKYVIAGAVLALAGGSAGSALASPCTEAERGTYLSNVCWLFNEFPGESGKVLAANETDCTASIQYQHLATTDSEQYVLHFNRVDLKASRVVRNSDYPELSKKFSCWQIKGENVAGNNTYRVLVCGFPSVVRLEAAIDNLFEKYCEGTDLEF